MIDSAAESGLQAPAAMPSGTGTGYTLSATSSGLTGATDTVAIRSESGTLLSSVLAREFGLSETAVRSLAAAACPKKLPGEPTGFSGREKGPSGSESPHAGDAEPIRRRHRRVHPKRGSPSSASE